MIRIFYLQSDRSLPDILPDLVHMNDINKAIERDKIDQLYARTALRLISKNSYQHVADIDIAYPDLALNILNTRSERPWYFNNLVALTTGGKMRKSTSTRKQLRDVICGDVMRVDNQFFLIMGSKLISI